MKQRTKILASLRSELVGPELPAKTSQIATRDGDTFVVNASTGPEPLFWRESPDREPEEILYFAGESPKGKYGVGRLWPEGCVRKVDESKPEGDDRLGFDASHPDFVDPGDPEDSADSSKPDDPDAAELDAVSGVPEAELGSSDVYHPACLGVSICVSLEPAGSIEITLPRHRRFSWQEPDDIPFPVNGVYRRCKVRRNDNTSGVAERDAWRRQSAVTDSSNVTFTEDNLAKGVSEKPLSTRDDSGIRLFVQCIGRRDATGRWIVTVVLRNLTPMEEKDPPVPASLFQTYFEIRVRGGRLAPYPQSPVAFEHLDADEQSLALLYRDSKTWGIGHGCAAAWDLDAGREPEFVYADVLPTVETPSVTPDIVAADGKTISLSMRALAHLSDDGVGPAWDALEGVVEEYGRWLATLDVEASSSLPEHLTVVARRHLLGCHATLTRMSRGITLLREDATLREAFRCANLSMLLQQIATKQLARRPLAWDSSLQSARPTVALDSPLQIYLDGRESARCGWWRAFQVGFLLLSLEGVRSPESADRSTVDLIWFPTGGGKTEAYLGVMSIYMFHQRLLMRHATPPTLPRDGTNVLMRYTLRMLTTQQFQRAASLICAMEVLRRDARLTGNAIIPGNRFSIGLWLGNDGSPKNSADAKTEVNKFRKSPDRSGNPLVLTECPWCRATIGKVMRPSSTTRRSGRKNKDSVDWALVGISDTGPQGYLLHCPDDQCTFGGAFSKTWLPVEVIDERIYEHPPSLVIATADKFAIMAYRPKAGAILGRDHTGERVALVRIPPGMIVQDELHLIAGPLGTIYGMYETVIEELCTWRSPAGDIRPKRIASTATIRGAAEQVRCLYGRHRSDGQSDLQLFPSPGLRMSDSFFGKYATLAENPEILDSGRLYVGIHANEYGSAQTAQVRTFSSLLAAAQALPPAERDPWWTLLAFYNSLRELGGAQTLVHSDIRARLSFIAGRNGVPRGERRMLAIPRELTGRRTQAEIVEMMDALSVPFGSNEQPPIDVCLASNIIEVGVDIDRLSLLAVVGQPKTTAQYIQVTGRVGRQWKTRPGLVCTLYSPGRSRDRSHYEQFHSYHRRLYEQVEPTTATPFARAAVARAAQGAVLLYARQHLDTAAPVLSAYTDLIGDAFACLAERCKVVESSARVAASLAELERMKTEMIRKWATNPLLWEQFPPTKTGEYLMLWPGQTYEPIQRHRGMFIPSSMRNVDGSAELQISTAYALAEAPTPIPGGPQ